LWRFAWLDQDQLRYLRYLEQLIGLSRDAVRQKSLQKVQPLVDDLVSRFQNRGLYNRLRYPSVMSVDSLARVLARAMRAETERSLVVAAVALRRYQLRHGRMVQSLSELVPEFVPAAPVDYMDGQPLKFRVQADGGFLLYSAMFAAVGAMSGNEQEARQAQQPVTYLLMISYLSIFALTNDPNSTFSMSLSLIPFTSPIAMPVRWTAGNLPLSEVLASLGILLLAIMGVTWVAARIYRVGILMTGKRPNLKELVRWVRAA